MFKPFELGKRPKYRPNINRPKIPSKEAPESVGPIAVSPSSGSNIAGDGGDWSGDGEKMAEEERWGKAANSKKTRKSRFVQIA
ncbi:hypothetical protein U1Q18_016430, partial [Sarracenia purpurea var. burkii]